ncbi:MAG: GTP cyclohydrolase I FolE [Lachnospiraceae bacterium]|nr:GTP cyclohydrolase I FolE [Lachnospiraceae bacterium]
MIDEKKIKEGVKLLLEGIGEDIDREGLKDTPDRIARMYTEIYAGYEDDASTHLSKRFHVDNNDIVLEKNIVFYSTCEHHMMPFYGVAHIAYIPNNEVVGISKLARTLEVYARRLQIQEKLTDEVADSIFSELNAKGVMVVIEAEHMCMTMRGIKKPGSKTVTMSCRGLFEKEEYKNRFFDLLRI